MLPATITARVRTFLLCAVAALIPWPFMYEAWALVGLAVWTVFTADWRATGRAFFKRKMLWASVLFFLLYAASYFWSEHKDTAGWAIESKLALLLLPVVLGAGAPVKNGELRWILRAAVAGVLGVALYCLGHAYVGWKATGDVTLFFYHKLVTGREPDHKIGLEANAVYMALYAYIALTVLISGLARGERRWLTVLLSWLAALPIAVFFVLLSSRTMLVLFAVLPVPFFLWYRLRQRRRSAWRMTAVLGIVAGCGVGIFYTDNPVRKRFADVSKPDLQEAFLPGYREHDQEFDNLTTRLFLWRVGLETAREHSLWWHGAGAGDVHYLTDMRMDALGIRGIYNEERPSYFHGVNMHNMPLQALLAVGVLGTLLVLLMMAAPVVHPVGGTEGVFWWTLAVTFALFMLQEAALQTQAGIVPFAFFSNFFWNRYWQVKKLLQEATVKPV